MNSRKSTNKGGQQTCGVVIISSELVGFTLTHPPRYSWPNDGSVTPLSSQKWAWPPVF